MLANVFQFFSCTFWMVVLSPMRIGKHQSNGIRLLVDTNEREKFTIGGMAIITWKTVYTYMVPHIHIVIMSTLSRSRESSSENEIARIIIWQGGNDISSKSKTAELPIVSIRAL